MRTTRVQALWRPLCAAALVVVLAGCRGQPPGPVAVHGKVLHQGKPAVGVLVTFWQQGRHGASFWAISEPDGRFQLTCSPGSYKVTVFPPPLTPIPEGGPTSLAAGAVPGAPPPRIVRNKVTAELPDRYRSATSTPLRVDILPARDDPVLLNLEN